MGRFKAPHFCHDHTPALPVRLGALSLKNRVVMAPLTRCRADNMALFCQMT